MLLRITSPTIFTSFNVSHINASEAACVSEKNRPVVLQQDKLLSLAESS